LGQEDAVNNKEHVLNKILNSEITSDPWDHLIIKDFLPQSLYNGVVKETEEYTKNKKLKKPNIRAYHIYVNKSVSVYPSTPFLKEYYDILLDDLIVESLKKKLSLKQELCDLYSELNMFTKGYVYDEIHPDRCDKAITMLHYLADEGDDESLGTFLYTPHKHGKNLDVFNDRVASSPYVGNCVLFFVPQDTKNPFYRTNHCMANKSDTTFLRKSFQTFWLKEKADWTKDPQKGRVRL
jgi:hypothetical protein